MVNEPSKTVDAGQFLFETGLLFEINRRVLHPLGLALMVERDSDGHHTLSERLLDHRADPEGIFFSERALGAGEDKLWAFMEEFGVGKMQERQNHLGYVIQKSDIVRTSESI